MRTQETVKTPNWIVEALAGLPPILTTDEVCRVLRCTRRHLYRMQASGLIPGVRAKESGSSRVLVPRSSLEGYLRSLGDR